MELFADQVLTFLFSLQLPFALPNGITALDVHREKSIRESCEIFYHKFYSDTGKRFLIAGINPGRFGGGVTGIPFTDPVRLENNCGINNHFAKKQELSSVFIYEMIAAYGGPELFYKDFYISSVSPLGYVKAGKNLNYYDDKALLQQVEPFAADCMERQLKFGLHRTICYCLGEGKNLQYINRLNTKYTWFKRIQPLPHPRFVMQYKLKEKEKYIGRYLEAFTQAKA